MLNRELLSHEMQMLQDILLRSEFKSLQESAEKQYDSFKKLFHHAKETVPFYQKYYANRELKNIADLPILTRTMMQQSGEALVSTDIPYFHGDCYPLITSGSTGVPVSVFGTDFTKKFYEALMLREHRWQQRDLQQRLVSIRWLKQDVALAPIGITQETWGPPIDRYAVTGDSVMLNIIGSTASHVEALQRYQPYYLNTYPSHAAALAEYCLKHNIAIPSISEVRFTGETVSQQQINVIKRAWQNCKTTDVYSSVEFGFIAQQCLEYGNYHVNVENVYLEIVDEHNQPCHGKPGRVLITSLMNYATPLIRYEIGDYAEWGEACPCGRVLPVLKKIYGRERNRLHLPSGETIFPYLGDMEEIASVSSKYFFKFQFVQLNLQEIELKVVAPIHYTREEELGFIRIHQRNFGYPFDIKITYHDEIQGGPTGKYEEFISLVA